MSLVMGTGPTRTSPAEGESLRPLPAAPMVSEPEPTLRDYARQVWSGRGLVLKLAVAFAAGSLLLALLLPPTYEAVTTAIPAPQTGPSSMVDQLGSRAQELGLTTSQQPNRSMTYPEIVRSRRLLEQLLRSRFLAGAGGDSIGLLDLIEPRGREPKRTEEALRKLRQRVDAVVDRRTGVLTLRVRASRPTVAAGAANALYGMLQEFAVHSLSGQAGENRRFIEGRLAEARADLTRAEEALRAFRESNLRIGNSPRLLLEQGRLTRDLRTQEEIFIALTRQYELATVDEHRDVPVINVLDVAVAPASRLSPRPVLMTAVGLMLGGALGAILLLARPRPGA